MFYLAIHKDFYTKEHGLFKDETAAAI